MKSPPKNGAPYQVFALTLSVTALLALVVQLFFAGMPETRRVLLIADTVLCAAFFIDFLVHLATADSKWRYLVTWGWIDLVSSIPVFMIGRWGRLARIARALQWIRALRVSTVLWRALMIERRRSASLASIVVAFWLLIGGSIAILQFEQVPGANILTAEDALWWALSTMTTVGYGDRFPVTTEGRMIAAVLMITGVGLFGVLSGTIAGWFLASESTSHADRDAKIAAELASLREAVDKLSERRDP